MKKKLISLALVCAMVFTLGATALADTELTAPGTGNTSVTYKAPPMYTVTIPAAVELGDAAVTKNISADNVTLEGGKQIKVVLESATYTNSGSTFSAKNGESVVKYSITADSAIGIGDTVATFTADGEKELSFTVTDKSGITVAGDHTETLTFKISVEDSTVPVTGVTLNKTALELNAGGAAETLTATVEPDTATDKNVTWSSSNTSVATVANGVVTPVAAGTATITATAGGKTATCNVTVVEAPKVLTSIAVAKKYDAPFLMDGVKFYYIPGETYRQAVNNHTENANWQIDGDVNIYWKDDDGLGFLYIDGDVDFRTEQGSCTLTLDSVVDPNHTYTHDISID